MQNSLMTGNGFRTLNILIDGNRENLSIEADHSLTSQRVIRTLERIIEWKGKPKSIRCNNSSEYIISDIQTWAKEQDIAMHYIQPGKHQKKAYIEMYKQDSAT